MNVIGNVLSGWEDSWLATARPTFRTDCLKASASAGFSGEVSSSMGGFQIEGRFKRKYTVGAMAIHTSTKTQTRPFSTL